MQQIIKEAFPIIESATYLNTPSSGLLSSKLVEFRRKYDTDLHTDYSKIDFLEDEQIDSLRTKIQLYFNANKAEIGLVPSYSFGINNIVEALPKKAKVVLLKNDYPSVNLPFEQRSFNIEYVEITENLENDIEQKLAQFEPDYLALSIVQFLNGIKIDLSFIQKMKAKYPKLHIIGDATQYLGTENFNFDSSGFSVVGSSGYKWFNAGTGNAFFMLSKSFLTHLHPKSYGSNSLLVKPNGPFRVTGFLEPGHFNMHAFKSLEVALDFHFKDIGIDFIEKQIETISNLAFEKFKQRNLLEDVVSMRKKHSNIFNLRKNSLRLDDLLKHNIVCAARNNGIRVGFQYFNTKQDLMKLIEYLDEI